METLDVGKLTSGDVSFVNIDGRVFTLTEVNCKVDDVFKELKEHLSERVEQYIGNTNRELFDAAESVGRAELDHITRQMSRGEHRVPNELVGQLLSVVDNRVMPVRLHRYAPNCVRGTIQAMSNVLSYDWVSRNFRHLPQWAQCVGEGGRITNPLARIEIRFKHPRLPQEGKWFHMAGDDRGVYSTFRTFHTLGSLSGSGMWFKQCTGNMTATQFWRAGNFEELLNTVNLDSPATSMVDFDWDEAQSVAKLVKHTETTILAKMIIMPDAWRAS